MTTATEVPQELEQELFLVESPVSEVYDIPFGRSFHVKSKLFCQDFVVRAYASRMDVLPGGWVDFTIANKQGKSGRQVGRPFHLLRDGVLFAMKRFKHRKTDSFALNHELFALEWKASVLLHFMDGKPYLFIISREEWIAQGRCGHENEELQVFIEMPDHRRLTAAVIPWCAGDWMNECKVVEGNMK